MKSYAKLFMKNCVILHLFPHLPMFFQCCAVCEKVADFFYVTERDCLKVFHWPVKCHRDGSESTKSEQTPHLTSLCKELMGMLLCWTW